MANVSAVDISKNKLVQKAAQLLVLSEGKIDRTTESFWTFSKALVEDEALRPYLWQRGLAAFYSGKYAEGAKQFESNMSVNGSDVEEVVWHVLCKTKIDGVDAARSSMLKINGKDDRPWASDALKLFQDGIEAVSLSAGQWRKGGYLSFYLGIYYEEILGDRASAAPCLKIASENPTDDYMGKLMVMHYQRFCSVPATVFRTCHLSSTAHTYFPEIYTCPKIIVGGWQLSSGHHEGFEEDPALINMNNHVEAGLNTFDMGDIYTGVEEMVGKFIRKYKYHSGDSQAKGNVQIHSKFVPDLNLLGDDTKLNQEFVRRIVQRSCNRLQVDSLDLCQFHWWDLSIPRYVEVAKYLAALQGEEGGILRNIGLTNFDAKATEEMLSAGIPIVSTQVQYSVLDQRPKYHLEALCLNHGIKMLCYGTLAGGFLTDRWLGAAEVPLENTQLENRSLVKYRLIIDEFGGWEKYQELLQTMRDIGDRHGDGASIAEVAIAFVLSRPGVGSCILGARSSKHIDSSIKACSLTLTVDDLKAIEAVTSTSCGPSGPVYALERERDGRHGVIMRYNLQELGTEKHAQELLRRLKGLPADDTSMFERLFKELEETEKDFCCATDGANTTLDQEALKNQIKATLKDMRNR